MVGAYVSGTTMIERMVMTLFLEGEVDMLVVWHW